MTDAEVKRARAAALLVAQITWVSSIEMSRPAK
jgi:hypothetical protein